jgi:plasmid stabilization system protein ParE
LVWQELAEATLYYERQSSGLSMELLQEVSDCLDEIAKEPELPRLRSLGYRRVNVKRFPFYIAYSIEGGQVLVLAIGHAARRPNYWIDRLS